MGDLRPLDQKGEACHPNLRKIPAYNKYELSFWRLVKREQLTALHEVWEESRLEERMALFLPSWPKLSNPSLEGHVPDYVIDATDDDACDSDSSWEDVVQFDIF